MQPAFAGAAKIIEATFEFPYLAHAALEPLERTGLWIYESKGGCWRCHSGANFTDESFHNTGVGAADGTPEPGRFAVTKDEQDRGRFKTPSLRGVGLSGPYFHDGHAKTLEEAVDAMIKGGTPNPHLDEKLKPASLTPKQRADLLAFLKAITPDSKPYPRPTLP